MIAAVVLAAGASTRFGSPKQDVLLEPVLGRVRASFVGQIVVVSGAHDVETDARTVRCPEWERGPGASLRCGLGSLGPEVEAAVVVLADGPDLNPVAIDRVVAAWRSGAADVLAASYGGVRGHPVLLARATWAAVPDEGARALEAVLVPCDDLGHPGDVDVPADLPEGASARRTNGDHVQTATRPSPPRLVEVTPHAPLAAARIRRKLTLEEAAARAGLTPDEVSWLEEGRVYRFASADDALLACILYASALEIDLREARGLAGLPLPPKPFGVNPLGRLVGVAAIAALFSAIAVAVAFTTLDLGSASTPAPAAKRAGPRLPPPWRIQVDVLNGSGDINRTRRIADRITALGYHVGRVTRADRFDYPRTAVYYQPGGRRTGVRLARQLGVVARPLPGGNNPLRHVVIVGPDRGPER